MRNAEEAYGSNAQEATVFLVMSHKAAANKSAALSNASDFLSALSCFLIAEAAIESAYVHSVSCHILSVEIGHEIARKAHWIPRRGLHAGSCPYDTCYPRTKSQHLFLEDQTQS